METVTVWRTFWRTIATAALLIGLLWIARAEAQTQCGPHSRIVQVLAGKFGEAPKAIGTVSRDHVMEVYISQAGSWTILVTSADGTSCILASGSDWEDVPFEPGARS